MCEALQNPQRIAQLLKQSESLGPNAPALWLAAEKEFGSAIFVQTFYYLSRLELSEDEARSRFFEVLSHQSFLAAKLGRNVALVTALSDYMTVTAPASQKLMLIEPGTLLQKEEGALRDELTGLFNRRYFNQEMPREIERFRRFGHPFSLLMLDLDHFKIFNDQFGHSAGDQALRDIAALLGETARLYDRPVRYGGEEFAIILPQACHEEALTVAERIRFAASVHNIHFNAQDLGPITVSIGSATFPQDALEMNDLVCRADEALYEAKHERNKVTAYHDAHRRHTRFPLSSPMPVHISHGAGEQMDGKTLDVSFGGLLCESRFKMAPGTTVEIILADHARGLALPLKAMVRRVGSSGGNSYHLGLSFDLRTREEQMTLLALLEGQTPDQRRQSDGFEAHA